MNVQKNSYCFGFFAIMSLAYKTAYCMSVNLTSNQINEAIKYGQTNKLASPRDFAAPWVVRLDEKSRLGHFMDALSQCSF